MKRTKPAIVANIAETTETVKEAAKEAAKLAQAVKDFVDAVPLKLKKPQRVRVPHTKEGGIDWSKFLKDGVVLNERPEGMPYHIYKQLLYEQKWKLKMRKR